MTLRSGVDLALDKLLGEPNQFQVRQTPIPAPGRKLLDRIKSPVSLKSPVPIKLPPLRNPLLQRLEKQTEPPETEDSREWWQFWQDKPIRDLPIPGAPAKLTELFGMKLSPEEAEQLTPKEIVGAFAFVAGMAGGFPGGGKIPKKGKIIPKKVTPAPEVTKEPWQMTLAEEAEIKNLEGQLRKAVAHSKEAVAIGQKIRAIDQAVYLRRQATITPEADRAMKALGRRLGISPQPVVPKAEAFTPEVTKVTPSVVKAEPIVEKPLSQKMVDIINQQKKLRGATESLQKEARAPKFEEIEKLRQAPKGEATMQEIEQALKGKLPHEVNPEYTLSPVEKDTLFNQIAQSSLGTPEVYPAQKALLRILDPDKFKMRFPDENFDMPLRSFELKYFKKVFGEDIANQLAKDQKWLRRATTLNNAFYEIYYNSLLSGKAQVRNLGSNLLRLATEPIETGAAVIGELPLRALSKFTGYQRARFLGEVNQQSIGSLGGFRDGVRRALHIIKTGERYSEGLSKYELPERVFKGKIGYAINVPSIGMDAGDALFRGPLQQSSLGKLAYRQAKMEGLKDLKLWNRVAELKSNPTPEIMMQAERMVNSGLFRENTKLADMLMKFRDFRVFGFQPLRPAAMFVRVPINVAGYGLARSPMGILNPKMWANIASKDPVAADQIGRVMLGSAVSVLFYTYAKEGLITGVAPRNPTESDAFYRQGKQPYSIRIGETWVSFQQIPLLGATLFEIVQAIDAIDNKDEDALEKASSSVYALARFFLSQTAIVQVSDFLDALTDPERYGENWLQRTITGLMPYSSASRVAAQAIDTTIRKPETIPEAFKTIIPGLSKQVPSRLTSFGEESKRETPFWSPINIGKVKESKVESELARLDYNLGFVGKTIDNIPLTPEQQHQYQEIAGQLSKKYISQLISNSSYKNLTDMGKLSAVEGVVRTARNQARLKMREIIRIPSVVPQTQEGGISTKSRLGK